MNSISCCSNVTRSALSSERKRYSVCVPLRRLRSLVCTMPRQLPGVTCTTFITRQRSFWCWMIMPTRSCVAGINIGTGPPGELGDGSSPLAPGLGARQPGACDAPPAGGRMSTGTITVSTRANRPAGMNGRTWPATAAERPFRVGVRPVEGSHRARRLLWDPRMNAAVPIVPRTLFRALVTRALGEGGFHSAASLLLSPLSALTPEDEVWVSSLDFDAKAPHPTPVVLAHGFLGNPGHFRFLRRFLVARGFYNFATFSYAPRVDHQE